MTDYRQIIADAQSGGTGHRCRVISEVCQCSLRGARAMVRDYCKRTGINRYDGALAVLKIHMS